MIGFLAPVARNYLEFTPPRRWQRGGIQFAVSEHRAWRGYLVAGVAVAIATLLGLALGQRASLADEAMLYALAILIAALSGRGPGLIAAGLSIGAFDFFFVDPRYTLDVSDPRFLITFAVMFAAGVAIGGLTSRLRAAEAASRDREQRTAALLSFTRDATGASDREGVVRAVVTHLRETLGVEATVGAGLPLDITPVEADDDRRQFVEAIGRQATIAIEKLQLAEAAREAELAVSTEKVRTALLSAVSHDLRTPLAVITGLASTLRETAPAAEHESLDLIVAEGGRLGRIVENLLAVTKVEAGAAPRREWVPIEELVGAALERLAPTLGDREITVDIRGDAVAHIDPVLGELLLANLLDNASKHAPDAPIELSARRDGTGILVEVADRGPGLPPGTEHRVFERFFRATHHDNGVGLGLAVCRGITAAHAGAIEAKNRDGGGAVFSVRIPDAATLPQFDVEPA